VSPAPRVAALETRLGREAYDADARRVGVVRVFFARICILA
jgi:hypothetical protein